MTASWIYPVEFNVVIEADGVSERTQGGLILPPPVRENQSAAGMFGTLVAVSPLAFNYDTWPEGATRPKVGDRVLFAKYAGTVVEKPGTKTEFRVCKDKDIIAVIHEGGSND